MPFQLRNEHLIKLHNLRVLQPPCFQAQPGNAGSEVLPRASVIGGGTSETTFLARSQERMFVKDLAFKVTEEG